MNYLLFITYQDYGWLSNVEMEKRKLGIKDNQKNKEAIRFALPISVTRQCKDSTHIQRYGWQSYQKNGL